MIQKPKLRRSVAGLYHERLTSTSVRSECHPSPASVGSK